MTGPDPYLPGHGDDRFSVEHYDLDLTYRLHGNHLEGRAVMSARVLVPTSDIELDLHRLRVTSLVVEGAGVARWSHRSSRLHVRFTEELPSGTALVVRVRYGGSPGHVRGPDGLAGWEELTDGALVAAQPHGAPAWFPCNDRMSDKATYRVAVATDPDYHVVGNGVPTERRKAGRLVRTVHEHDHPMAPYLATLQIGRYATERLSWEGLETWLAAPPALMARARVAFARQADMTALFERLFGPYPFEAYTVVVTDDPLEIPLESQSLSAFGRNHLDGRWDAERLIAHELSHQWFGNALTAASLSDIWLHEGFACYSEWLWSEQSGRASAEAEARIHHDRLSGSAQDLVLTDPGSRRAFDDRVYKRGALTLHALRRTVGDAPFFGLLRAWVDEHRYGTVSTPVFEAFVAASLGAGAAAALEPWLHEPALPALD